MNINLTEPEIKQAIQEYLNKRLVGDVSCTDFINLSVGRSPQTISAAVDIIFGSISEVKTTIDIALNPTLVQKPVKEITDKHTPEKKVVKEKTLPEVKEVLPEKAEPDTQKLLDEVKTEMADEAKETATTGKLDDFGAPITEEKVVEAPIVEGGNTMTKNFELKTSADNVTATIIDDVEDLFNC